MSIKRFILDSLKTKFAGIDEKVLSRIAATAVKTVKNEEEAKTYVEELTLQQVIDSYSDSRVTDAKEKAIKSYEEKYGMKDGKPADPDEETGSEGNEDGKGGTNAGNGKVDKTESNTGNEDVPAWAKALIQSNNALKEELSAMKAGKVADTRKATLDALLKDAPEKTKATYLKNFNRMQFKDDADFNEWIEEITPDIEDATTSQAASDGVVGRPKTGASAGNDGKPSPFVQARVNARKAETVAPAIVGLPKTSE